MDQGGEDASGDGFVEDGGLFFDLGNCCSRVLGMVSVHDEGLL